jgi:hypothetical protein
MLRGHIEREDGAKRASEYCNHKSSSMRIGYIAEEIYFVHGNRQPPNLGSCQPTAKQLFQMRHMEASRSPLALR